MHALFLMSLFKYVEELSHCVYFLSVSLVFFMSNDKVLTLSVVI